jgi:hypothetical protein
MSLEKRKLYNKPAISSRKNYTLTQRLRSVALEKAKDRLRFFRLTNRSLVLVECINNLLHWREAIGHVLDWHTGNITARELNNRLKGYEKIPCEDLDILVSKTFHVFAKIHCHIDAETLSQMLNCPLEQAEWAIIEYKRAQ